jgi:hypothetical protein
MAISASASARTCVHEVRISLGTAASRPERPRASCPARSAGLSAASAGAQRCFLASASGPKLYREIATTAFSPPTSAAVRQWRCSDLHCVFKPIVESDL